MPGYSKTDSKYPITGREGAEIYAILLEFLVHLLIQYMGIDIHENPCKWYGYAIYRGFVIIRHRRDQGEYGLPNCMESLIISVNTL